MADKYCDRFDFTLNRLVYGNSNVVERLRLSSIWFSLRGWRSSEHRGSNPRFRTINLRLFFDVSSWSSGQVFGQVASAGKTTRPGTCPAP
jgi:hypothetical protein